MRIICTHLHVQAQFFLSDTCSGRFNTSRNPIGVFKKTGAEYSRNPPGVYGDRAFWSVAPPQPDHPRRPRRPWWLLRPGPRPGPALDPARRRPGPGLSSARCRACRTCARIWESERTAGRGPAWLRRLTGGQESPGSNPGVPTLFLSQGFWLTILSDPGGNVPIWQITHLASVAGLIRN